MCIRVAFILYCHLLSVQQHYVFFKSAYLDLKNKIQNPPITAVMSEITDHHNKRSNTEKAWNIVRIATRWHRALEWAHAVGKMTDDLLDWGCHKPSASKTHSVCEAQWNRACLWSWSDWEMQALLGLGTVVRAWLRSAGVQPRWVQGNLKGGWRGEEKLTYLEI